MSLSTSCLKPFSLLLLLQLLLLATLGSAQPAVSAATKEQFPVQIGDTTVIIHRESFAPISPLPANAACPPIAMLNLVSWRDDLLCFAVCLLRLR